MWNAVNHCLSSLVLRAVCGVALLGGLLETRAAGQDGCVYGWATGAPFPGMNADTLFDMIGWDPDGPGPAGEQVIISANFTVAGNLFVPGQRDRFDPGIVGWTGSEYRPFFAYPPDERGSCRGLGTYDPDGEGPLPQRLYTTRWEASTLDVWNGLGWDPVPGISIPLFPNTRLKQFDPDGDGPRSPLLVIGGRGGQNIFAFNGTTLEELAPGAGFDGAVYGMTLYDPDGPGPAKSDLIVWGQFSNYSGAPMMQIARYDGMAFHAMGAGLGTNDANFDERVYDVVSYDADGDGPGLPQLVATGQFVTSGAAPINRLAVWNGTAWQPFAGTGISGGTFPTGLTLGVAPQIASPTNASDLLVGGQFTSVNGVAAPNLARFNGATWSALTDTQTGVTNPGGSVQKLVVYDPDGAGAQQRRVAMWGQPISNPSRGALVTVEYDLGTQRYSAMPASPGVNTPSTLTVYDSDGTGPALPRVILGQGSLINPTGTQADSSLFDGRNFIQMPANSCARGSSVAVWDADGPGPGNPVAVFGRIPNNNTCGFQAWDGTGWSTLPGTPFPRASVFDDPPMQLTTWDPDGPGALTPRLIAATYLPYSNGAALGGIAQYNGASWGPIGAGFSAGRVWALTTWDFDNSGVRRLVAVGTEDLGSNGVPVTGVTMFDGTNWVPVGNIAPFNDPGRQFVAVTAWDRDGPGPLPEVLVVGRQYTTLIYDGTNWTPEVAASREIMTRLSTWDRDGTGPELPLLTICSRQVQVNGGGFYALDRFLDTVQYAGYDVNASAPYDPDGPGPAPEMLCIGGRFTFVNTDTVGIDPVVAHRFAYFDKFNDLWASPSSGDFGDPSRWECGTAPRPVNSVVFDATQAGYAAGTYTVTLPAGAGAVQAERMRVRTDTVTLNLNGRNFQTTKSGTFVDPALVIGEIANTPASLNITNTGAPADLDIATLAIGQTRGTSPAVQQLRLQSANARLLVSGDSLIGHRAVSSTLALQSGAQAVLSGGVSIGDQPQSGGALTVVGSGTTLLHSNEGESVAVGLRGAGFLQIGGVGGQAGASAATVGEIDVLSIGSLSGGVGNVLLSGTGSLWDVDARTIAVGYGGSGTVDVSGGATWTTNTSSSLTISAFPGASGLVRLRGAGTLWQEATSVLTIGDGGILDVGGGATFAAPAMTINTGGRLIGSGTVSVPPGRAVLQVFNFGQIDPEPDTAPGIGTLTINGDLVQSSVTEGPQTILDVPFEAPAFTLGPINGQGGWTGDGVVQNTTVNAGAQALLVDASNSGVTRSASRAFNFPLANLPVRIAMDFRRSGAVDAQCGFSVFGNTGFIAQMANIGAGSYILGNTNSATPARNFPDNAWHRLEILLNYQARTMTGTIDGVALGQLAISNNDIPSALTAVSIYSFGSSGSQFIHIDNVSVSTVLPPGSSPNKSGVVAVDVAGTAPGLFDKVVVNGVATIGGGFRLKLAGGFNPAPGSISNLELFSAAGLANPSGRFDVAYFPGLPSQPDGSVPYFKLDYNQLERAFSVGVSLGTLQPPNFNDPTVFNVAGGPTSAAAGDFNADGFLDLAVTVPDAVNPTTTNGLAVVLLNAGVSGNTWLGFGSQVSVTVGRNPNGIAVGRFRGPAQPLDIAVANTTDGSVMRLGNSGGGLPSFGVSATLNNVGVNPVSLAASDLNADGTVDLAVANSGIVGFDPGNARILTNNGAGTFSNGTVLVTGFNPVSIAAARINGDTFDDLVTANSESADISVFIRDASAFTTIAGDSFLPPRTRPTSPRPVEVVPGGLGNPKDLDNDVAVICQPQSSPGSVDVFANRGDGSGDLQPSVPLTVGNDTSSLALLDMDGDGDTDIAALAEGTGPNAGTRVIRVLRNDSANAGSGQLIFALQPGEIVANSPTLIRAADINNDGLPDLVTVNSTTGTLAARPGEPLPDGRTATRSDQPLSAEPLMAAPPDRLVNPIAVVPTAAPPPLCPGDFNDDNAVNTADLVIFLGNFGTTVPPYTQGDLNGDGSVNTSDLVNFLGRFGQACP